MGKLTTKQAKHLAEHLQEFDKAYRTQIYFCFDSEANGKVGFNDLQNAYRDVCNYSAWSGWFGIGNKRDFYLGFKSKEDRDAVFRDIQDAKYGYEAAHPEVESQYDFSGDDYSGDDYSGNGGSGIPTKTKSWTTYIVIGAAAIIILLLLWDRKKK